MADGITAQVVGELERAMRKFPTWPTDPLHALAVLGEEFGELTKDVLQLTYEPHKTSRENVRTEAIQTAAMALRFAASLDAYDYRRGEQHTQDAAALGVSLVDGQSKSLSDIDEYGLSERDRERVEQWAANYLDWQSEPNNDTQCSK